MPDTGLRTTNMIKAISGVDSFLKPLHSVENCNSPLSKRVENWGESGRALSYGIVWGPTSLKRNARGPTNDPIIERAPTLAPGFHPF